MRRRSPHRAPGLQRARRSRLGLWAGVGVGVLVVLYAGVLELSRPHVSGERVRLDTFVKLLGEGRIAEARILDADSYIVGTYHVQPATATGEVDPAAPVPASPLLRRYNVALPAGTQRDILELVLNSGTTTVTVDQQVGKRVVATASLLFPGLILVVLFLYLILSFRRGTGLFGIRSGARRFAPQPGGVTFADVAGQDSAVAELREVTRFLADPERFRALGAQVPKGVLLFGPPGCGKTLMARALAGESGAAFFSISGSDFVELYVGVGASRVRELFREARENAPAVIFIDELDSVGRRRGERGGTGNDEREQALNQVLAELDGFSQMGGIIVVAATNRPDVLDPALLRPGRFDRSVGLERPGEAARLAILELHAGDKRWAPGVDLASVASRAIGMTGADLAGVMNEAALLAARDDHPSVSQADLERALQRALDAPERQRRLSLRDRSVGRRHTAETKVTFADVAGAEAVVEELADVVAFLAHPEAFDRLGARAPRGVLLTGPPGCGKTLLARALAGEANAAFFSVGGSDFVELFVGMGAARVRDLFAEAAALAPAIVFIDEIDSIGAHRGGAMASGGTRESDQALNQVLIEMDGFEARTGVIVVGATNRPDMLDRALLRPGRFDRQVAMSAPDRSARRAILAIHARGKPWAADVDLDVVAGLARGMTGADLANLCNEAAVLAVRRGAAEISAAMVEDAFDRVSMGLASAGVALSEPERRCVAYHEAGHALVALTLPGATPPHKVTIVARGASLGHCRSLDGHDRVAFTRSALVDLIAVSLAGRLAETVALGEVSGGAAADLAQARRIARQMVRDEAMGEGADLMAWPEGESAEASRAIEEAERGIISEATERARGVLAAGRDALDRVAAALLEHETVTATEIEHLAAEPLARRPEPIDQEQTEGASGYSTRQGSSEEER